MEIVEYYHKIKELQLNGTLNNIYEEIRLHDKSEAEKFYHDRNYKMKCIHFYDRLMDILKVGPELGDQIAYYYYQLLINDKEFRKSKDKYDKYVEDIETKERKNLFADIKKDKIDKAEMDKINNFIKNL